MASGHANRSNRPHTWPHRPIRKREESPCQLGAVHTWGSGVRISSGAPVSCIFRVIHMAFTRLLESYADAQAYADNEIETPHPDEPARPRSFILPKVPLREFVKARSQGGLGWSSAGRSSVLGRRLSR
jgi:hypothetical protein